MNDRSNKKLKNINKPKHTPGPWNCFDTGFSFKIVSGKEFDTKESHPMEMVGSEVLSVETVGNDLKGDQWNDWLDQLKIDMNLVAAAPEMLEALKDIETWFQKMKKDHDKKLGKSFADACKNWPHILQEPLEMEPIQKAIAKAEGNTE